MDSLTLARDGKRREALLSLAGSLLAWGGWCRGRLAVVVSLSGSGDGGQAWREQADAVAQRVQCRVEAGRVPARTGAGTDRRTAARSPNSSRGQVAGRDDQVVTVQNAADVPGQRQLVPLRGGDRAGSIAAAGWVPADASGTWPGR